MRWAGQGVGVDDGALPGLARIGFVRTVRTPQFDGITFHEVLCKSALNKVPEGSTVLPFRFTINAYRGCSHACRYCFARPTHEYLDLDSGADFDSQIVVKTNIVDVLRRDLPAIAAAAARVPVSVSVSLAVADPQLHHQVEPGVPSPQARLGLITAIRDAGLPCHVMVAPVLPYLTDSVAHLDVLLEQIAAAGACSATVFGLHLRGATRPWFMSWLARDHPDLVGPYRTLYRRGAYLPQEYRNMLRDRAAPLIKRYGLGGGQRFAPVAAAAPQPVLAAQQTLF
ncbi:MAG: radical SAM protein [Mycobacterium sp.]|nr:radical SAM protein [Mycobacterium sp.]